MADADVALLDRERAVEQLGGTLRRAAHVMYQGKIVQNHAEHCGVDRGLPLIDGERPLVELAGLIVVPLHPMRLREIGEREGSVRMIRAEYRGLDRQAALKPGGSAAIVAGGDQGHGEVVPVLRGRQMSLAQKLGLPGDRPAMQPHRRRQPPLAAMQLGELGQQQGQGRAGSRGRPLVQSKRR